MDLVLTSARMLRFGWQLGSVTKRVLGREPTDDELEVTFAMAKRVSPGMNDEKCVRLSWSLQVYWQARAIFVFPQDELDEIERYAWKFPHNFLRFIEDKNLPLRTTASLSVGKSTFVSSCVWLHFFRLSSF